MIPPVNLFFIWEYVTPWDMYPLHDRDRTISVVAGSGRKIVDSKKSVYFIPFFGSHNDKQDVRETMPNNLCLIR